MLRSFPLGFFLSVLTCCAGLGKWLDASASEPGDRASGLTQETCEPELADGQNDATKFVVPFMSALALSKPRDIRKDHGTPFGTNASASWLVGLIRRPVPVFSTVKGQLEKWLPDAHSAG
jgi:hypothetical protein